MTMKIDEKDEMYLAWAKHCSEIGEALYKEYEKKLKPELLKRIEKKLKSGAPLTKEDELDFPLPLMQEYRKKIEASKLEFCEKMFDVELDLYNEGKITKKKLTTNMKVIKALKENIK